MGTQDLAKLLANRNAEKYKHIIKRALLNGYHDFKFDSIPGYPEYGDCICPKMQLIQDLAEFPELIDISQQVIDGKYDESPDKEDDFQIATWLMDDNSPDVMFEMLGLKVPTNEEREKWHQKKFLN